MIRNTIRSWKKAMMQRASERFHTPAYQSYSVEDYLKKMGVDIKEVTGDEGICRVL